MSLCPDLAHIERGGADVEAHLSYCAICRSLAALLEAPGGGRSGDCARAELLIAGGSPLPLPPDDGAFLSAHLGRCPACRESAHEPPAADGLQTACVDPETYALGAEIGRGGMGRVLAARDRRIGRSVALKEMLSKDPQALVRFEREARITARLQHPSIVSIYEVGRWPDGRPFYAMPILRGRTLREAIGSARTLSERLRLLPAVIAAADAIAYAHSQRIIHRDLNPSNILVGSFGETTVIDWGVAKELDGRSTIEIGDEGTPTVRGVRTALTEAGTVIGTPGYMAPEQAEGRAVDERTDIYALGAILFHALSGRCPWDGAGATTMVDRLRARELPPLATDPSLPRDLLAVSNRAMAPAPARRYQAAQDFVEELRRYQAGELVHAYVYSLRERATRWVSRHVALVATACLMFVVVAATTVLGTWQIMRERKRADETIVELDRVRRLMVEPQGSRMRPQPDPIKGWQAAGSHPADYEMGVDRTVTLHGRPTARVRANKVAAEGFGTLMQTFPADAYLGKRVRLRAQVKSAAVENWAGLWMRVDSKWKGDLLAFDNMQPRPITGTRDWRPYEVVLDVPREAGAIAFGILLGGQGSVWIADITIEAVDERVPTTDDVGSDHGTNPRNLALTEPGLQSGLPRGWTRSGEPADDFEMGIDDRVDFHGRPVAYVRSKRKDVGGFATLMQKIRADGHRGRWVRFSATLRSDGVAEGAGLWVRIDGLGRTLAFDNMQDRPLTGTTDWVEKDVILPVDTAARAIAFGVLLRGSGRVAVADMKIEAVDAPPPLPLRPMQPRNLAFTD